MWYLRGILVVAFCSLGLLAAAVPAHAQHAGGIGFRNELKGPVVVHGTSIINGRRITGLPILIPPGKVGWDNRLPPGIRLISVYDANQPNLVLIRNEPVPFQGRDIAFVIFGEDGKIGLKRVPP